MTSPKSLLSAVGKSIFSATSDIEGEVAIVVEYRFLLIEGAEVNSDLKQDVSGE